MSSPTGEIDPFASKLNHHHCSYCHDTESEANRTFKTCSSCKVVRYCCKICQKAAWPLHRSQCRPPQAVVRPGETTGQSLTVDIWLCVIASLASQDGTRDDLKHLRLVHNQKDLQLALTKAIYETVQVWPRLKRSATSANKAHSGEGIKLDDTRKAILETYVKRLEFFGTAPDTLKSFQPMLETSDRIRDLAGRPPITTVILHSPALSFITEILGIRGKVTGEWTLYFGAWHEKAPQAWHTSMMNHTDWGCMLDSLLNQGLQPNLVRHPPRRVVRLEGYHVADAGQYFAELEAAHIELVM